MDGNFPNAMELLKDVVGDIAGAAKMFSVSSVQQAYHHYLFLRGLWHLQHQTDEHEKTQFQEAENIYLENVAQWITAAQHLHSQEAKPL